MIDTINKDQQNNPTNNEQEETANDSSESTPSISYRIQFRENEQIFSAESRISNLKADEIGMVQTDHGLEPVKVIGFGPLPSTASYPKVTAASYTLVRRGTREEAEKFASLITREKEAFEVCRKFIEKHKLAMRLIKVERFFNGSKIIFYFTAENRVDFRELVKDLVQEFRTRVEIRQIGVRHETKMIGGVGCCGRELCCCSFIKKFAPVSIKMAKEQNLPLNPAKISGICNRLLCCLTYEFDTYHETRKKMPKIGKTISLGDKTYKVVQHDIMHESIVVADLNEPDKTLTLTQADWANAQQTKGPPKLELQPSQNKKKEPQKQTENNTTGEQ